MQKRAEHGKTFAAWWLARTVLGTALAGTLVGWLEPWWWLGEVAACFRPFFAIILAASTLVAWTRERPWWALGFGLLAFSLPWQLLPGRLEMDRAAATMGSPSLTVYSHNVNGANRRAPDVIQEIQRLSPDIAVLIEIDSWWAGELAPLENAYPYHRVEAQDGCFGIALFSRIPLRQTAVRDFSGYELPSLLVSFDVDGRDVTLIGTHPPPPVSALSFRIRNWQFAELAREARIRDGPVILVGDLNAVPWSAAIRRLLRESGLRKSGVSREPTWSPVRLAWMGFPIDYQLASREWSEGTSQTGDFLGSDHRWTLVKYHLEPQRR